jgi:histidinol-phosphate/aromatic aminotransferase/cobyric acid decarboxylase-like protein
MNNFPIEAQPSKKYQKNNTVNAVGKKEYKRSSKTNITNCYRGNNHALYGLKIDKTPATSVKINALKSKFIQYLVEKTFTTADLKLNNLFVSGAGGSRILKILADVYCFDDQLDAQVVTSSHSYNNGLPYYCGYHCDPDFSNESKKPKEAQIKLCPRKSNHGIDFDAILSVAKKEKIGLISIVDPENPVPSVASKKDIDVFIDAFITAKDKGEIYAQTKVVIDLTYINFDNMQKIQTLLAKIIQRNDILCTFAMSKLFALSDDNIGQTIGFACAGRDFIHELENYVTHHLHPLEIIGNTACSIAIKSLIERTYTDDSVVDNKEMCAYVCKELRAMGFNLIENEGITNFVLIEVENGLKEYLVKQNIKFSDLAKNERYIPLTALQNVAEQNPVNYANYIRITMRDKEEMDYVLSKIKAYIV